MDVEKLEADRLVDCPGAAATGGTVKEANNKELAGLKGDRLALDSNGMVVFQLGREISALGRDGAASVDYK